MSISKTIVINAAGMGSRLSFGHTKALLEIGGKPLIYHHLDAVEKYNDVRIVVGYDYEELIRIVLKRRKNITFVTNHEYRTNGTLYSLFLGSRHSNSLVVSIDGDLLINPKDLKNFLNQDQESIAHIPTYSDNPVCVDVTKKGSKFFATGFHRSISEYEWTGLAQLKNENINNKKKHVYQTIESILPIRTFKIDCREIDTPRDLVEAMRWSRNIFKI